MRFILQVSLWAALLATTCCGKPRDFHDTNGGRRGALSIGDLEITFSEDDYQVPTPPFLLAIFETSGGISDSAMDSVEKAMSTFVLEELQGYFGTAYVVKAVNTGIFSQEYDTYDSRRLGVREPRQERHLELTMAQGIADTTTDKGGFLRGRRKLDIPGSVLGMQVNVTFDQQPAPSEDAVDKALKDVMQDLFPLVEILTAMGESELDDVMFAFRREIPEPTESPTLAPTLMPTVAPTETPTDSPTETPTVSPTESPTLSPTDVPTKAPTEVPTATPTETPTATPTKAPTSSPTGTPTDAPSITDTESPTTVFGSGIGSPPTKPETASPTDIPETASPTISPTDSPTPAPTDSPTEFPTDSPTVSPTDTPTVTPTLTPTGAPTVSPTVTETQSPTVISGSGNISPTKADAASPTVSPTNAPTVSPTVIETQNPTVISGSGNISPTKADAASPTDSPTVPPTVTETESPTVMNGSGNISPTEADAASPTVTPTAIPAEAPVEIPTTDGDTEVPTTVSDDEFLTEGASPWNPNGDGSDMGDMFDSSGQVINRGTAPTVDNSTNNSALIASIVCVGAAMVALMGFLLYRRRRHDDDSRGGDHLLVVESDLDSIDPSTIMSPSLMSVKDDEKLDSVFGGLESGSLESPHVLAKKRSASSATTVQAGNNAMRQTQTPRSMGGSLFAFSEEDSDGEAENVEVTSIGVLSQNEDSSRYIPKNLETTEDHLMDTGSETGPPPISPALSDPSYSKLMKADESDWKPTGLAAMVAGVMGMTVGAAVAGRRKSDASELKDDPDGSFPSESEFNQSRQHAGYQGEGDGTMVYQTAAAAVNPLDISQRSEGSNMSELNNGFCGSVGESCKDRCNNTDTDSPLGSPSFADDTPKSAVSSLSGSIHSKDTAHSSQFSASRQLINDLVWLERRIADVKTTGDVATSIRTDESEVNASAITTDSLSSAHKDVDISATGGIDCREFRAPPGRLHVVIHSTRDGPAVHEVRAGSPLEGQLLPGDLIIAVDNDDTRALGADQVMKMMGERGDYERKITVLRYTGDE